MSSSSSTLCVCRPMVSLVAVTTSSSHPPPEHAPFSGWAVPTLIGRELILLQLNIEGISKAKLEIISHLAWRKKQPPSCYKKCTPQDQTCSPSRATPLPHIPSATATALPHSLVTQPSGTRLPSHNLTGTWSGLSRRSRESTSPTFTSCLELVSSLTPYHTTCHLAPMPAISTATEPPGDAIPPTPMELLSRTGRPLMT